MGWYFSYELVLPPPPAIRLDIVTSKKNNIFE